MQLLVRGTAAQRAELVGTNLPEGVTWVFEKEALSAYEYADVLIDLLFENTDAHKAALRQFRGVKIINSVTHTLAEIDTDWVRIAVWNTFLQAAVWEGSCRHEHLKKLAEQAVALFQKTIEWLLDVPGFVTPRVVSLIINEAHFALAEGVSTRTEIDLAMQLGTAYPYGPFAWSEKIGLKNIVALLERLSKDQPRYAPAPLLTKEAGII